MALALITLGEHFLSDVLAGLVLALGVCGVVTVWSRRHAHTRA